MSDADIVRRVEMLEETLDSLRSLPARVTGLEARVGGVESQILQLRTEMRDEFSAIHRDMATRQEMASLAGELRQETAELGRSLRAETAELGRSLREEMAELGGSLREGMAGMKTELREDIAGMGRDLAGLFLESQRQTRVLFEEGIARVAALRESDPGAAEHL